MAGPAVAGPVRQSGGVRPALRPAAARPAAARPADRPRGAGAGCGRLRQTGRRRRRPRRPVDDGRDFVRPDLHRGDGVRLRVCAEGLRRPAVLPHARAGGGRRGVLRERRGAGGRVGDAGRGDAGGAGLLRRAAGDRLGGDRLPADGPPAGLAAGAGRRDHRPGDRRHDRPRRRRPAVRPRGRRLPGARPAGQPAGARRRRPAAAGGHVDCRRRPAGRGLGAGRRLPRPRPAGGMVLPHRPRLPDRGDDHGRGRSRGRGRGGGPALPVQHGGVRRADHRLGTAR